MIVTLERNFFALVAEQVLCDCVGQVNYNGPRKLVLRHLLCKNLISKRLKDLDLLWKRTPKARKLPISSSCTEDDAEPQIGSPSKTDAHRASATKDVTGIVLLHEKRAITLTLALGIFVHPTTRM